jgi:hypothetical protein
VTFRRVLAAALTVVLLALAAPAVANAQAQPKGTDVLGQLFGRDKYGGHLGDYSLSSYQLDWDVDTDNDVGLPGGIGPQIPVAPKPKGAIADVAEGLANFLWSISLIVVKLIGGLFAWAFSIDFLTGPHGILQPIGNATRVMYRDLFGREVLWIAILISAGYAITHMRRGHRGGAGRTLVAAVVYAIVAIGVSNNMVAVARPVYQATQGMASSVLAMKAGAPATPRAAEREANQYIRDTFVDPPFQLLEFGGLAHCVNPGKLRDGYPTPVLLDEPGAKVCRSNARYAKAMLAEPPGSDERKQVLQDLAEGKGRFDKIDAPAADMMLEGNAYLRLAISVGVLAAVLFVGAFILFAGLVIALSSVAFAIGLAFAPVMAPLAFIPGYGEAIVRFWAVVLAQCLLVKVAYSLVLGVLMVCNQAVTASASLLLPAGTAFAVNAAMFAAALFMRKHVTGGISAARSRIGYGSDTVQGLATGAVTQPIKAVTGRLAFASVGGVGGAVVADALDKDDDHGGGGNNRPQQAPPFTPPPYDHEPNGGTPPPGPTPDASEPDREPERSRETA